MGWVGKWVGGYPCGWEEGREIRPHWAMGPSDAGLIQIVGKRLLHGIPQISI